MKGWPVALFLRGRIPALLTLQTYMERTPVIPPTEVATETTSLITETTSLITETNLALRNPQETFKNIQFLSSGSTMLDLALGGGWAMGRIVNIVGDKSSGKTLQVIEAFANFKIRYPKGKMRYGEAEAAFDDDYARTLGFPEEVQKSKDDKGKPKSLRTVTDFHDDVKQFLSELKGNYGVYALDSLDALSSTEELNRNLGDATYGAERAKQMSEFFRRLTRDIEASNCLLMIISQVREDIGASWGDGLTRSGGKALDFFATQICWLKEKGKYERQLKGQMRPLGIYVQANIKKNKAGMPFRKVDYTVIFSFGVDDELSMLDWLQSLKAIGEAAHKKGMDEVTAFRETGNRTELTRIHNYLVSQCTKEWAMLEEALAPKMRKYI